MNRTQFHLLISAINLTLGISACGSSEDSGPFVTRNTQVMGAKEQKPLAVDASKAIVQAAAYTLHLNYQEVEDDSGDTLYTSKEIWANEASSHKLDAKQIQETADASTFENCSKAYILGLAQQLESLDIRSEIANYEQKYGVKGGIDIAYWIDLHLNQTNNIPSFTVTLLVSERGGAKRSIFSSEHLQSEDIAGAIQITQDEKGLVTGCSAPQAVVGNAIKAELQKEITNQSFLDSMKAASTTQPTTQP